MSQLNVNTITTLSGTDITIPTGKKLVVTDAGGLAVPGTLIQVVSNASTTQVSTSNNTVADILSTTITPKFSTSKILVLATVMGVYRNAQSGYNSARVAIWLYRGGSAIQSCDGTFYIPNVDTHFRHGGFSIQQFDNPATTSATTYTLKFQPTDFGAAGQVNRDNNSGATTLTLLEIAQ